MAGKTPEEIAFDLLSKLKGSGVWGERNMSQILDMYSECLDATMGKREYEPGAAILGPRKDDSEVEPQPEPQPQPEVERRGTVDPLTAKAQLRMLQKAYEQGVKAGASHTSGNFDSENIQAAIELAQRTLSKRQA